MMTVMQNLDCTVYFDCNKEQEILVHWKLQVGIRFKRLAKYKIQNEKEKVYMNVCIQSI